MKAACERVRGAGGFECRALPWAELAASPEPAPAAWILIDPPAEVPAPAAATLAARPTGVPVISIGAERPAAASCWFAELPADAVLGALLRQYVPQQKGERTWRRKSDMIVGRSPAITAVLQQLDRFAPSTGPVLITGESGTGKELVARALHYSSPRSGRPFLAVNCAAIPETLFESELFGYVRGAFTGAATSRKGVFEAAEGGTVFLDEIGELPVSMQPKLLRVLESGEITRLGSNVQQKVQFRLVSATNRPLEEAVKQGIFREDLYYRVRVFPLALPPLRERPEDIPPLIFHSLSMTSEKEHQPMPKLTSAALARLLAYRWPGNVRELVNVLHRALLQADRGEIDAHHITLPDAQSAGITAYSEAKEQFEERYYTQLLGAAAGNISTAARLAQKTRKEIYDALKRLSLDPARFRGTGTN